MKPIHSLLLLSALLLMSCREDASSPVGDGDASNQPRAESPAARTVPDNRKLIVSRTAELPVRIRRDAFSDLELHDGAVIRGTATQSHPEEGDGEFVALYAPPAARIVQLWLADASPLYFADPERPFTSLTAEGEVYLPHGWMIITPNSIRFRYDPGHIVRSPKELPHEANDRQAKIGFFFLIPTDVSVTRAEMFGHRLVVHE